MSNISYSVKFKVKKPYWIEYSNYFGFYSARGEYRIKEINENSFSCEFWVFDQSTSKNIKSFWQPFVSTLEEAKEICFKNHKNAVLSICKDFVDVHLEKDENNGD